MWDIIHSSFSNLMRKPVRSILTIIAVSIGVSSVILINIIGSYGKEAINTELNSLGMNGLLIAANDNSSASLTEDELETVKSLKYVEKAAPLIVVPATVTSKSEDYDAYVWGIGSDAKDVIELNLMYGRFISEADCASDIGVCMVDNSFARNAYGRDNIVGKTVAVSCDGYTSELKVVGVIQTGSGLLSNMMGSFIPNFVYTTKNQVQQAIKSSGYHRIAVEVTPGDDTEVLSQRLVKALELSTGNEGGYTVTNLAKQKDSLSNIMNIISAVLSGVGGISLFVASMGIMTIMLVSVSERTREIGIKKSIGATKSIIVSEFLCESTMLSLTGCAIGILLSLTLVLVGGAFLGVSIGIDVSILIYSALISLCTGVIFGVYPAVRASSLKPVDALRHD